MPTFHRVAASTRKVSQRPLNGSGCSARYPLHRGTGSSEDPAALTVFRYLTLKYGKGIEGGAARHHLSSWQKTLLPSSRTGYSGLENWRSGAYLLLSPKGGFLEKRPWPVGTSVRVFQESAKGGLKPARRRAISSLPRRSGYSFECWLRACWLLPAFEAKVQLVASSRSCALGHMVYLLRGSVGCLAVCGTRLGAGVRSGSCLTSLSVFWKQEVLALRRWRSRRKLAVAVRGAGALHREW